VKTFRPHPKPISKKEENGERKQKLEEYRREQYLLAIERDGGMCCYCGKSAADVHHKYGRDREAGDPKEHYSNLECVCRESHPPPEKDGLDKETKK